MPLSSEHKRFWFSKAFHIPAVAQPLYGTSCKKQQESCIIWVKKSHRMGFSLVNTLPITLEQRFLKQLVLVPVSVLPWRAVWVPWPSLALWHQMKCQIPAVLSELTAVCTSEPPSGQSCIMSRLHPCCLLAAASAGDRSTLVLAGAAC